MMRIASFLIALFLAAFTLPAAPKVGDPCPEIQLEKLLQAPANAKVSLADLKGKAFVLEFWATWCGPCIAAFPHINDLSEKYKDKALQFIAVSDEDQATVEKLLAQKPLKTWVGLDTDSSVFNAFEVRAIPMTVLVDKEGKIAAITHPTMLSEANLDQLLEGKPVQIASVPPPSRQDPDGSPAAPVTDPDSLVSFSVSKSGAQSVTIENNGPILSIQGGTLAEIIGYLESWGPSRVLVAARLNQRYDVIIKMPNPQLQKARTIIPFFVSSMGIFAKKENRDLEAYTLTVGELKEPYIMASRAFRKTDIQLKKDSLTGANVSMTLIAAELSKLVGKPVIDESKSTKVYDLNMTWKVGPSDWPAVFEQLGLKLTPVRKPIEVWVLE